MAREFAYEFYNSGAWKKCRAAYAKYRRNLCERCLAKGIVTPGVIVHHKIYLTPENIMNPAVALNFDNLELLCRSCHEAEHNPNHRRYTVDDLGRVAPLVE